MFRAFLCVNVLALIIDRRSRMSFLLPLYTAFMSLIAERKGQSGPDGLASFLALNPDLLDKDVLKRWYSEERLTSATARGQFLLPDKVQNTECKHGHR